MSAADRVCLVTGAARGLGAEVVTQLRAGGATAVAVDRRSGDGIRPMDVTNEEQWAEVIGEITDRYGRIDVLVNNAGIIRVNPILDTSAEEFRKVVDTNLVGTFLGLRAVAPAMIDAGGGSIINLGSPGSVEGTAGMGAYTSSKWGIRGLTRTAALEFGPSNVRVNMVIPGPMRTAMTTRPDWTDEDYASFYGQKVPLGRMGDVAEVAALICWLASDASSFCTGSDFHADGGITA
jgi:3alpha(or 20beta)-hydroxysteroid dehydrogenase